MELTIKDKTVEFDDRDKWLLCHRWWIDSKGYVMSDLWSFGNPPNRRRMRVSMHRFLMYPFVDEEDEVDHIDGNPLNNHRSNLRIVSHGANLRNIRHPRKDSRTGFQNVGKCSPNSGHTGYRARLRKDGRDWIRYFDTPEEAYAAAQQKRRELGFEDKIV